MTVESGDSTGLASVAGTLYTLGLFQELYRVNASTAVATLIGPTGIPPVTDFSTIDAVTVTGFNNAIYLTFRPRPTLRTSYIA